MLRAGVASITTKFEKIIDPRQDRTKRHKLLDMITVALCAAICGADSWVDVEKFGKTKQLWFEKFLELENGIPSHDTFSRVFGLLDSQEFLLCLRNWLVTLGKALKHEGIAIDGKTLRGSFDAATGKSALHVVSAWACGLRVSLGQVAVDGKSNEIPAVRKLLELLEISGAVVTLDAMHCQAETLTAIRAKGADFLVAVKDNQPALYTTLLEFFAEHGERDFRSGGIRRQRTSERNHGRDEERLCYAAPAPPSLRTDPRWNDVTSVVMIYRRTERNGKTTEETAYYITSLEPQVQRLAKLIRGHWGIENTLHWTLDVIFAEDASRIRKGNGPEIASIFRKIALMILQRDTSVPGSIRGKRLQAGWNNDILERILSGFSEN